MAPHYQLPELAAMPVPSLTGRFLAHNRHSRVDRAFFAADLYFGAKRLTMPTLVQAAILAGVNRTYAFWATKPQAQRARAEIERGLIPLVPLQHVQKSNGTTLSVRETGID